MTRARPPSAFGLYPLVFLAGVAALCWEVLWQLEASLAIGVSAKGTSITLAATMGGMCLGSIMMGRLLRARTVEHPLRVYGSLELLVGVTGAFFLLPGFRTLERVDGGLYVGHPGLAAIAHFAGIVCILGPATLAMGATIPVLGLMARATRSSIATLYAVNTAGASLGVLLVSFVAIPHLGIELAVTATACVNLAVAASCWLFRIRTKASLEEAEHGEALVGTPERYGALVVLVTGLISLGLEVAWFRALRAAFLSTTQAFAIMLVSVLIPLAVGARLAKSFADKRVPLGTILVGAGAAVLLATPVVERFDRLTSASPLGFWATNALWLGASLAVLGPSMVLLGVCLPWILREHAAPHAWGRLYAVNTLGAVAGSLLAAWVLLPAIGFARTAWLLGAAPLVVGVAMLRGRVRWAASAVFASTLAVAFFGESGIGRDRVQGNFNSPVTRVLAFDEGPNSSVAVAETKRDGRMLVIDGFVATGQSIGTHYMAWMGRLPMVLHPNPRSALVICFGDGTDRERGTKRGTRVSRRRRARSCGVAHGAPFHGQPAGPRRPSRPSHRNGRPRMAATHRPPLRRHHARADAAQLRRGKLALFARVLRAGRCAAEPPRAHHAMGSFSPAFGARRPIDRRDVPGNIPGCAAVDRPQWRHGHSRRAQKRRRCPHRPGVARIGEVRHQQRYESGRSA
jgi:spermidine synthase